MYRTQRGERTLGQKEAAVFKAMLREVLVWFEPNDRAYDDDTDFGIPVFDSMSYGQKLWSLDLVARALLLDEEPAPPLHAFIEATVGTVFTQADVLLDSEEDGVDGLPFRSMLLEAICEIDETFTKTDAEELGFQLIVEFLEECILWDSDFLDTYILDKPPEVARAVQASMGIPEEYFLAVADDPDDSELQEIFDRVSLLSIDVRL